jgi:hypothetical protein
VVKIIRARINPFAPALRREILDESTDSTAVSLLDPTQMGGF